MQLENNNTTGFNPRDLITKFYYNNNHLCFQILMRNENGESTPYKEFTDYNEYRKVFNELTMKKNQTKTPKTSVNNTNLTNITFA